VKIANQAGNTFSIIDNRMGSYPFECIEKFVSLALWCCNNKPDKRPSILDVVREFEHILEKMSERGTDFCEPESSVSLMIQPYFQPKAATEHSNTSSRNEVLRIRGIFTTWIFPGSDLFGPYELLNFTLVGPSANSRYDHFHSIVNKCKE
ncbi:probable LRR receptor-like serine/threonine-protein kinase isoform X2, partial [Tanacetum coccineum]